MKRTLQIFAFGLLFAALGLTEVSAQTFQDGLRHIANQNYREARTVARLLEKEDEKSPEPFYLIGSAFLEEALLDEEPDSRAKLIEQAKQPFLDGIERKKKFPYNYVGLGRYYVIKGDLTQAKANFDIALATAPSDPILLTTVANAYLTTKEPAALEEATRLLTRAEGIDPQNALIAESIGDAWTKREIEELPMVYYQNALKLNPSLVTAHHKLGKYYVRYKKYTEAAEEFKSAQDLDPSYAPVYLDLGELYFLAKKYPIASDYYKKYVELRGNDRNARYRYAQFLYLSEQYTEALAELGAIDTTTLVKYRLTAYSGYEAKQYLLSQTNIDELFAKAPEKFIIAKDWEYRGKIKIVSGDTTGGVADVLKSIELDPTRADLYQEIVKIYNKSRNYAKALEIQKLAVAADPGIQNYFALGQIAYFAKDYTTSIEGFNKVIELRKDFLPGYLNMGRSQSKIDTASTGMTGLAKPFYEKVIELSGGDEVKYKKELSEAYTYMTVFNLNVTKDNTLAKEWLQKLLKVDPNSSTAKELGNYIDVEKLDGQGQR